MVGSRPVINESGNIQSDVAEDGTCAIEMPYSDYDYDWIWMRNNATVIVTVHCVGQLAAVLNLIMACAE